METTLLTLFIAISLSAMLYATILTYKEIKECIKCKKLTSTIIGIFTLLIQCFATIVVIKVFIHCILN